MEAAESQIYQLGLISVEIFKKENKVRYQLMIPLGSGWDDAIAVCDEFKATVLKMKETAAAQEQALQEEKEEVCVEPEAS